MGQHGQRLNTGTCFSVSSDDKLPTEGRIQDFKLGGVHLKKLRRAEGGAKNFGVFRVFRMRKVCKQKIRKRGLWDGSTWATA
jgi:hypothetical protein